MADIVRVYHRKRKGVDRTTVTYDDGSTICYCGPIEKVQAEIVEHEMGSPDRGDRKLREILMTVTKFEDINKEFDRVQRKNSLSRI